MSLATKRATTLGVEIFERKRVVEVRVLQPVRRGGRAASEATS